MKEIHYHLLGKMQKTELGMIVNVIESLEIEYIVK